jgi:hypothetical protein
LTDIDRVPNHISSGLLVMLPNRAEKITNPFLYDQKVQNPQPLFTNPKKVKPHPYCGLLLL